MRQHVTVGPIGTTSRAATMGRVLEVNHQADHAEGARCHQALVDIDSSRLSFLSQMPPAFVPGDIVAIAQVDGADPEPAEWVAERGSRQWRLWRCAEHTPGPRKMLVLPEWAVQD